MVSWWLIKCLFQVEMGPFLVCSAMKHLTLMLAVLFTTAFAPNAYAKSVAEFMAERNAILETESSQALGSDIVLNDSEILANEVLTFYKISELDSAFANDNLPSSESFLTAKSRIDQSDVFQFIKIMPKGAALHLHELAITSVDWVVSNVTYL